MSEHSVVPSFEGVDAKVFSSAALVIKLNLAIAEMTTARSIYYRGQYCETVFGEDADMLDYRTQQSLDSLGLANALPEDVMTTCPSLNELHELRQDALKQLDEGFSNR